MATTATLTQLPPVEPPQSASLALTLRTQRPPADDSPLFPLPPSRSPVSRVLDKDKDTPDSHVPRDPRLIRLTGVHPFNAEAPLTALYDEGFLTSVDLFYVRNHGPVPDVQDSDVWGWEFSVEGLVERPFTMTLRQLVEEFEQITQPVTLVCAGNRRKEQNVVRKTKGFSWGAAGLSTALFTGTLLANVLRRARPLRRGRYLCMEGADKLPNGYYGTSVKLNWALDPNKGIMLAHGMNGAPLRADHGRPLRVVVPGQIGGRSVKWLRRLVVTEGPSENWYHLYDNKVLPTTVTPEMSAAEPAWWKDDRYAIYDLNVNSAVVYPQHDEVIQNIARVSDYTIKGYAYSGGGRRVTRVEISLNSGKSWRLAELDYPEDRYREAADEVDLFGGRVDVATREASFCWCFWSLRLPVYDLQNADSIVVRAMDESMVCQPRDMYWSVLGMLNNPWFRVAIVREGDGLRFEHPTTLLPPGATRSQGWMERVKKTGGDLTNGRWGEREPGSSAELPPSPPPELPEISMVNPDVERLFSLAELREESSRERPLFVVDGEVYDGTAFLEEHPGGAQSIIAAAASDATEEFMGIHSENAKGMMRNYHVGTLSEEGRRALRCAQDAEAAQPSPDRPVFLDPARWTQAVLRNKTQVSPDTKLFTFELDHEGQEVGLPVGQHLMLRLRDPAKPDEAIVRAYTPVSDSTHKGTLDVLIKLYLPPPPAPGVAPGGGGGRMTTALDQVPLGTRVDFKGPIGKFTYLGRGRVRLGDAAAAATPTRRVSSFVMICGGSGITPIFQVFRAIAQDAEDETSCTVLYGNRGVQDILLREELEGWARRKTTTTKSRIADQGVVAGGVVGGQCRVLYTLTNPPATGWDGRTGRISEELLRQEAMPHEDGGGGGAMALVCGPPAMEQSVREILLGLGWKRDDLVFF